MIELMKKLKDHLFEAPLEVPLPDIYKTLAYYLIKEDYVISTCNRVLYFNNHSASVVMKDKTTVVIVVYSNNNDEQTSLTPINFNPTKMAEHDKCFWAGVQCKLTHLLTPLG